MHSSALNISPIPTIWNGRKFRSRLEARWAVFFDALGVRYEYEKEGYQLKSGVWYLPDFWLTDLKFWIEIKPSTPNPDEYDKASELSESSGLFLYMAIDPIFPVNKFPSYFNDVPRHIAFLGGCTDEYYWWTRCPTCGELGIQFQGRGERICRHDKDKDWGEEMAYDESLKSAYSSATLENFNSKNRRSQCQESDK